MADRAAPARAEMQVRLEEAKQYIGSDAYAVFVRLLIAIDRCYDEDLRQASDPRMSEVRGASKQCRQLIDTLIDREGYETPKI